MTEFPQRIRIERMLPLYEAKMIHHFDHRWATYDGGTDGKGNPAARDVTSAEKGDPDFVALPRYWVPAREVDQRLRDRGGRGCLMGWRDIARSTDERTVLSGALPRVGVGHTYPIYFSSNRESLLAPLNSFPLDFVARQKVAGTHLTYGFVEQLPVPPCPSLEAPPPWDPTTATHQWLAPSVLELTYTAWDMAPFARDLGDDGPPFVWDDERRFWLRAELDAAFFHLYGIARDDVDYIMDTFPIVRRKDEAAHGEYRTKRVILELYDRMQRAIDTGVPYTTPIDPPPGQGPRHPNREEQP